MNRNTGKGSEGAATLAAAQPGRPQKTMAYPTGIGRRAFLAGLGCSAFAAQAKGRILLGGPIFLKSDDPRELAREHRRLGYNAALCPRANAADSARVREIEAAFAAESVVIAEVGAWNNMLDTNPETRRTNLQYVVERLALADAVGARCCVNIAGSFVSGRRGPHPDDLSERHFDATVENCRHVIDEVKPKRTKFTIEMMSWCLPDGPDAYLKLIKAVSRQGFGVHFDPFNGINCAERYYHNAQFITDCVRKLGSMIVSCHAKDLDLLPESNIHLQETIPGRGHVDYRTYLRELSSLGRDVPLILEHLQTAEEYTEGATHIRKVARETGVDI
jgi:sugar phosphate isomerase/epimerase